MTTKTLKIGVYWSGLAAIALLAVLPNRPAAPEDDINFANCVPYQSCRDDCWYGWRQDATCGSGWACITFLGDVENNPPTLFKRCVPTHSSADECKQPRDNGIFIADCRGTSFACACRSETTGDCSTFFCNCLGQGEANRTYHVRHQCVGD